MHIWYTCNNEIIIIKASFSSSLFRETIPSQVFKYMYIKYICYKFIISYNKFVYDRNFKYCKFTGKVNLTVYTVSIVSEKISEGIAAWTLKTSFLFKCTYMIFYCRFNNVFRNFNFSVWSSFHSFIKFALLKPRKKPM